jgi:glucuronate isomerase
LVGGDIVRGELPADLELSGAMVKAICFSNARDYFRLALDPAFAR